MVSSVRQTFSDFERQDRMATSPADQPPRPELGLSLFVILEKIAIRRDARDWPAQTN